MITDALDEIKRMAAVAAKDLRARAPEMDGTAIIAEEEYVPEWSIEKDYINVPVGSPVKHGGQVFALLQPHTPANYPGTSPETLPALWQVKHTTDPEKAKDFVAPTSTSDMYFSDECMVFEGKTYRAVNPTVYSPADYAADWEVIE